MKPIEPGCLVVLIKSLMAESIGSCHTVVSAFHPPAGVNCWFCGGRTKGWMLSNGVSACECVLIRIGPDDDPDAVTEPTEQEETA